MLVSVYCLAYNHEKYIRGTLEGFVNQKTNFEFEVFVHDDASTDNTVKIILEYAEKYPNIIKPILQEENQYSKGVTIFQTHIWPKMSGKYVAVCEGDDYWCDSNKLQRQVDFLEKNNEYVACVHNTRIINMQTGKTSLFINKRFPGRIKEKTIVEWKRPPHLSSLVYRREVILEAFKFMRTIHGMGDYPLELFLMTKGKIFFFPRTMSVYRRGVDNSWTMRNKDASNVTIKKIKVLEAFDVVSNYKYSKLVNRTLSKFWVEYFYFCDFERVSKMGYLPLIKLGYWKMAVSVFLQKHCYAIYKVLSELLYGRRK